MRQREACTNNHVTTEINCFLRRHRLYKDKAACVIWEQSFARMSQLLSEGRAIVLLHLEPNAQRWVLEVHNALATVFGCIQIIFVFWVGDDLHNFALSVFNQSPFHVERLQQADARTKCAQKVDMSAVVRALSFRRRSSRAQESVTKVRTASPPRSLTPTESSSEHGSEIDFGAGDQVELCGMLNKQHAHARARTA